ncbi:DUF2726 domain-containing protein [Caballeronia grimmiae]|uniref:DUF2726 domain-containing protein n=1 Tax=Caballeronia grimmiae TaxID=1071679 RepID=UPI0038B8A1D8
MTRRKRKIRSIEEPEKNNAHGGSTAEATETALKGLDVFEHSKKLRESEDWEGLLRLGATPISAFLPSEQQVAPRILALCRVQGRARGRGYFTLRDEGGAELLADLEFLQKDLPTFHNFVEFDLLLGFEKWTLAGTRRALKALMPLYPNEITEWNLPHFRSLLAQIRNVQSNTDDRYTEEEIRELPDLRAVFVDVCARVEADSKAHLSNRLLAKAWRLDEQLKADGASVGDIAAEIRTLPYPEKDALYATKRDNSNQTCHSWAFFVEASRTDSDGWEALLLRYPERLGNDAADGVRLIIKSSVVQSSRESLLIAGVQLLLHADICDHMDFRGRFLLVTEPDGTDRLDCDIHMPSCKDVLERLLQRPPKNLVCHVELRALIQVMEVAHSYSTVEDTDLLGAPFEGSAWLSHNSPGYVALLGTVAATASERMFNSICALRMHVESGFELRDQWIDEESFKDVVDVPDLDGPAEELRRLATLRDSRSESHFKRWASLIPHVFAQFQYYGPGFRTSDAYAATCEFREDLLSHAPSVLGHLDELAGHPARAMDAYLTAVTGKQDNAVMARVDQLVVAAVTESHLDHLRDVVDSHYGFPATEHLIGPLRQKIKQKRAALQENVQFEKTAVNRWPSLTMPARKLLSVLATIKTWRDFDELGRYASMPADWASKHYQRLLNEGMVIKTADGYRINKHIEPLIERESQHSVIARIIRTDGATTAVKQVFNSEREFAIYQAIIQLCPNHLVFPNCGLQSIFSYDKMKELVSQDEFGYFLRASVDVVVVSTTTYLPLLAIEVDSIYHDTEKQLARDERKDRIFEMGGVPLLRLRPLGSPSAETVRSQVAAHLNDLIAQVRPDMPGHDQAVSLLRDLTGVNFVVPPAAL